ncbi:unnamed protein product, partial [Mesorhabditis belari]|uniref:BCAS3 domain-containing protein n=1 Tax=Mesorhabditis belari TaxID=2138241 RepID=A0AAF3J1P9_9BILA
MRSPLRRNMADVCVLSPPRHVFVPVAFCRRFHLTMPCDTLTSISSINSMRDGSPPSVVAMTSKKKKRNQNQAAVHPVQQVQPQPQPTPESDIEENFLLDKEAAQPVTSDEPLTVFVPDPEPKMERKARHSKSPPSPPTPPVPISSTPPHSTVTLRSSASPSPSVASLPALYEHRRESSSTLNRLGSPRQSSRDLAQYTKGIVVKPQPPAESDVVSSMFELVHELSSSSTIPPSSQPEKVEWVEIQKVLKHGDPSKSIDIIILGLARGFQIWTITESGVCEEVLSERQGPLRIGKLLPSDPEPIDDATKDRFAEHRPLFGLVDSSMSRTDNQFCCLRFLSLGSGNLVHKLSFPDPILAVEASLKWFVVATGARLVICDHYTLQEQKVIETTPIESQQIAFALRFSYLAWADTKLRSETLSIGGVTEPLEAPDVTYTGQMLSAVKSLSRTVTSVSGSTKKGEMRGVVTIACLDCFNKTEEEFTKLHFMAQEDPVSHIDLSYDCRLLMTADASAREFNVFSLMPHSATPVLATAQHLYVLNRGTTPAKVLSTCFSNDSRWLCIATNHGTVHVFAINPYGGVPTARTHAGGLLNQQSKFSRSAGLSEHDSSLINEARQRRQSERQHILREHPSQRIFGLARASGNPRIGPFPPPLMLKAAKKIRERRLNTENLSAWATDLTHTSLSSSTINTKKGKMETPKMALAFASRPVHDVKSTSVLVLTADGVLCEYGLHGSTGQASDEQIRLDIVPQASWTLYRTKNTADLVTPLQAASPLMRWTTVDSSPTRARTDSYRIDPNTEWNGQVEDVCTYSVPHRRLWQGPQFAFFSVNEAPEPVQVSSSDYGGTQSIPIVIGDGDYGPHATRVEWCGSASGERTCEKERDEIAKRIADAMGELEINPDVEREEKSSIDDVFFDSTDHTSITRDSTLRE